MNLKIGANARLLSMAFFAFACSLVNAQGLSQHEVEGGGLISGTAMTYDAPKGWTVNTKLNPNTYISICSAPDDSYAYMIISSLPNAYTLGGPPGTPQQTGNPPPQSLLGYLGNFLGANHVGKITKVLEQNQAQIPATMNVQGSSSVGFRGFMRVLFTDAKDGKPHEGLLSCEIQSISNRFNRLVSGTWIVNNFFLVAAPPGGLNKAGAYFTKCLPTYQFTDEYVAALTHQSIDRVHEIGRGGGANAKRINEATEKMVSAFKEYMRE
jgi:hypothetical protein